MTFSEIAGRLLKGSGSSHPPSAQGPISEHPPSLERVSGCSLLASPGSDGGQVTGCGGMVGNNFGEPRGHSINASSWAKIRPLSDIRELTEPSLAEPIQRKPLPDKLSHSASRQDLSHMTSVASRRRPSVDTRNVENK
jgi:hypothetical protein